MVQRIAVLVLLFLVGTANAEVKIGIFGDLHGDRAVGEKVLRQMKAMGVTHVIGTGDFVRFEGPTLLQEILSQITPITGVPKSNIFLFPGNWEHETGFYDGHPLFSIEDMNNVMRQYGQLVFERYDSSGQITIGGEKIFVSHFPQHQVPEEFLPPAAFRRRLSGRDGQEQAFVMDTIERGAYPPADAVFGLFAHTHIGGYFRDEVSGKIVINPGVLDSKTKSPDEPRAFAVYEQGPKTIRFFDADRGSEITALTLDPALKSSVCVKVLLKEVGR